MKSKKKKVKSAIEVMAKSLTRRRNVYYDTLQKAKPALARAVSEERIDLLTAGKIESQLNRCIQNPHLELSQEYTSFLIKEIGKRPWERGF